MTIISTLLIHKSTQGGNALQLSIDKDAEFLFSDQMRRTPQTPNPSPPHAAVKEGTLLDLVISDLDEDGYGIAHHEGKKYLVSGALPGETVRSRVTHSGRRVSFAATVKILRHSPARLVNSPCAVHNCDGCPLVAMKYPAQLDWKGTFIARQMGGYESLSTARILPVIASPAQLGYRNTAKLVVAGKHAQPLIGMYRRNTHDVIDMVDCPLHHPLINRIIAAVRTGIRKGKVDIYSPRTGNGLLRYLVIRVSETTNQAMVVFVTSGKSYNEIHHLAKHVQSAVPEVVVTAQNSNSSEGNVILGDHDRFLSRERSLTATIGTTRFTLSPRSFFQVNSGGAAILYDTVRDWAGLTGSELVIDLYCGVGGISLYLAGKAREVIGIEVVEAAVADAVRNARLNDIRNCRFETGDAAELLAELQDEHDRVDLVILNPPRKGCEQKVLERVTALGPTKLIYVSCSPVSLARDLDILAGLGYRTDRIQPVDMFPQTPHVENVALLTRK